MCESFYLRPCGKLTLRGWPNSGGGGRVRAGRKKRLRRKSSTSCLYKKTKRHLTSSPIGEIDGNVVEIRPFESLRVIPRARVFEVEIFVEPRHFAKLRMVLRSRVLVFNVCLVIKPFRETGERGYMAMRNAGREILGGFDSETISAPAFRRRPNSPCMWSACPCSTKGRGVREVP